MFHHSSCEEPMGVEPEEDWEEVEGVLELEEVLVVEVESLEHLLPLVGQ